MSDGRTFVIVGASMAGAKAAETLRLEGFEGRVLLVGEEVLRPYQRPPLSKEYLRGEVGDEKVFLHDASFYDDQGIELRLGTRVGAVDVKSREIVLGSDERVGYDALLIATGAAPRPLPVPGSDLGGIHYLRNLGDADLLRDAIQSGGRVVVIGGGWIGCEVAASARQLGADVAMVEGGQYPLQRVLGTGLGRFYRDIHAEQGVELHLGVAVESLRGESTVREVCLSDGESLAADVVVVGVGVSPRIELAEAAGLTLDNGIVTDEYLATSAPGVFAAGDVSNAWHPLLDRRIRLEHWSSALNQGPVAAKNMLGISTPYTRIPYFFSDQYEIGMEYTGLGDVSDEMVFRGDPDSREFVAFWMRDGRVAAGMNVNVWDVADPIAALIAAGGQADSALLGDPDVDLASLVE